MLRHAVAARESATTLRSRSLQEHAEWSNCSRSSSGRPQRQQMQLDHSTRSFQREQLERSMAEALWKSGRKDIVGCSARNQLHAVSPGLAG